MFSDLKRETMEKRMNVLEVVPITFPDVKRKYMFFVPLLYHPKHPNQFVVCVCNGSLYDTQNVTYDSMEEEHLQVVELN